MKREEVEQGQKQKYEKGPKPKNNLFRQVEAACMLDVAMHPSLDNFERERKLRKELKIAKAEIKALKASDFKEKLLLFGNLFELQPLGASATVEIFEREGCKKRIGLITLWRATLENIYCGNKGEAHYYFYGMKEKDQEPRPLGETHLTELPGFGAYWMLSEEYEITGDSVSVKIFYRYPLGRHKYERRELEKCELKI